MVLRLDCPNCSYPDHDSFARHHIRHNPVAESGAGSAEAVRGRQHEAGVEDGAAAGLEVAVLASAVKRSIGFTTGCTITEKAPTRAFSWLKAPTSTFTFKTLLRHYAKRELPVPHDNCVVYPISR